MTVRNLILIFCSVSLLCSGEIVTIQKEWTLDSNVRILHSTAIGNLYRFDGTENSISLRPSGYCGKNDNCINCRYSTQKVDGGTLEISLTPKERKRKKRYLAIDFKVRAYPALSKVKSPVFRILLMDADRQISGASYPDIHGLLRLENSHILSLSNRYSSSQYRMPNNFGRVRTNVFTPDFEPVSFRVVFDLKQSRISLGMNGERLKFENMTKIHRELNITNLALTAERENRFEQKKHLAIPKVRSEHLEISHPRIHLFDHEEECDALPPFPFQPYSYKGYPIEWKNTRKERYPDPMYARALRMLYSSSGDFNPDEAEKLLKKAERDRHVIAQYQLALCYFRGYFGRKNSQSGIYLKRSARFHYANAKALRWFIEFKERGEPWFLGPFLRDLQKRIGSDEHDPQFCKLFQNSLSLSTDVLSPKYLTGGGSYVSRKNPKLKYVDHVIRQGYLPGRWLKARRENDPGKKRILLEEAYRKGDRYVLPELLETYLQAGKPLEDRYFTPEMQFAYRDRPLYRILTFLWKNPDSPLGPILLSDEKLPPAVTENPSQEIQFLCAMYGMARYRFCCYNQKMDRKMLKTFSHLSIAANGGYPPARYMLGRCFLYYDIPENHLAVTSHTWSLYKAEEELNAAWKAGETGAGILIAEIYLKQKGINMKKALNCLKESCAMKDPYAVWLTGRVLEALNRKPEAGRCYREAAELGEIRALRDLSEHFSKTSKERLGLLRKYIVLDQKQRAADRFDPFWTDVYAEFGKWEYPPSAPASKSNSILKNPIPKKLTPPPSKSPPRLTKPSIFQKKKK